MKTTERTICWEIRGRRLVDGALVDQHVATGFGADAASAIRWARYNEPSKMAAFPDADLRAIPDPINLPSAPSLLTSLCLLVSVCAEVGGQSISAGFSCPEAATRAGAGVGEFAGFDSLPRETAGPADLISVASGTDRKRPHKSEPWLSPDSLGAQSERAVSMLGGSHSSLTSPTETFPTPGIGFTNGLSAVGLRRNDGVGNSFSPAVGGNQADRHAQRELREETVDSNADGQGFGRSIGEGLGDMIADQASRNKLRMGGAWSALVSILSIGTIVLTAFTGIAVLCASAASGRLEDR